MFRHLIAGLALGLALAGPAWAQSPATTESIPTWEQLKAWKKRVIDPYPEVVYLDVNKRSISEADFMRALHDEHPRHEITQTDVDGRKTRIVLTILPPDSAHQPAAD